jgi:hypothetical protein
MFLRRCLRKKNGKPHTYGALVESYRTARGSRQRLVAYVGERKESEQSGWAPLGRRLEGQARPPRSLFDPPHSEDPTETESVEVSLQGVRFERLRDFGEVWLALGLWRLLGLDTLLVEKMPDGRGRVFDNIFIERLWRSVKVEEVYLHDYQTVRDVREGLGWYFPFYNGERPHQALGYCTPAEVYTGVERRGGSLAPLRCARGSARSRRVFPGDGST